MPTITSTMPTRPTRRSRTGAHGWRRSQSAGVIQRDNAWSGDDAQPAEPQGAQLADAAPRAPPPPPAPHEQARRPKLSKTPESPSQEEIDAHMMTHLPFKRWCEICVACRKNNLAHKATNEEERKIPFFSADYCFLQNSGADEEDVLTTVVARVRPSRLTFALGLKAKGGGVQERGQAHGKIHA